MKIGMVTDDSWWREFILLLAQVGYDDVLSIEHEDVSMSPIEGMRKSVDLLNRFVRPFNRKCGFHTDRHGAKEVRGSQT